MDGEVQHWGKLADRLGIQIVAPATIQVGDLCVTFTALLPDFGGVNGMVVDADGEKLGKYSDALLDLGYGYSAVEIGQDTEDQSATEMFKDWRWTGFGSPPPWM